VAGPFITAEEFCEWTGMGQPADLARLQALCNSASALIRSSAGQILSQETGDQIIVQPEYDTRGRLSPPPRALGDVIELPEKPVTAVSITVEAVAFTDFGFTTDGFLYRTDGKVWNKAATITYSHGYAETSDEFQMIRTVCIKAVARAYTRSEAAAELQGSLGESVGWVPEMFLTPDEMQSLPGGLMAVG
jgi:hypothetical protein